MTDETLPPDAQACGCCGKIPALCVCADIVSHDNRIGLLILQHPQEQDVDLGTARLTAVHFRNAKVKIGLSWPSLAKALGRAADPKRWAVLYLGSARLSQFPARQTVVALNRKGEPLPDQDGALAHLQGVIVLDGTWSQAKVLWWRNPWLLKTRRIALNPARPSRYGRLRREARREALSTLEATALLMSALEDDPSIADRLHASFERLLDRYRALKKS